jgi:PAS domain-containing protein
LEHVDDVVAHEQKHLALILSRELATQLATATFIADADGDLVFYNEAAEDILGRSYAEAGSMSPTERAALFRIEELDGTPVAPEELPSAVALAERRPLHRRLRIVALDGERRALSATAIPLFSHPDEIVGVMGFFWDEGAASEGE